jgi:hypothetical protein
MSQKLSKAKLNQEKFALRFLKTFAWEDFKKTFFGFDVLELRQKYGIYPEDLCQVITTINKTKPLSKEKPFRKK